MTRKLTARKHVCASPHKNAMPMESHSDGQHVGYFLRTLRTLLLELGYSEPSLFIGVLRMLHGNSYLYESASRPLVDFGVLNDNLIK
jgi:hypothetical protein